MRLNSANSSFYRITPPPPSSGGAPPACPPSSRRRFFPGNSSRFVVVTLNSPLLAASMRRRAAAAGSGVRPAPRRRRSCLARGATLFGGRPPVAVACYPCFAPASKTEGTSPVVIGDKPQAPVVRSLNNAGNIVHPVIPCPQYRRCCYARRLYVIRRRR